MVSCPLAATLIVEIDYMYKWNKFYKKLTIVSSLICIVFFGLSAIEENVFREWRRVQSDFKEILISKASTDREIQRAENFPIEIRQVILKDFDRVDRCVSCHNGIEDPRMDGEKQPHRAHSSDYLLNHPVEKFGCSICHGGQDRALTRKDAFATSKDIHWDYPIIPREYLQSSCGRCHLSVFNNEGSLAGAEKLTKGRDIFIENGCLGCHHLRGIGGNVGPELTNQGKKTKHQYSFEHVEGEHTLYNWIKEHFLDPAKISPESNMPSLDLSEQELESLTTYTMSFYDQEFPLEHYDAGNSADFKTGLNDFTGKDIYGLLCSFCHGENGGGEKYPLLKTIVPALNNQDFLSVTSENQLRSFVEKGRSGRLMASWAHNTGGLGNSEMEKLTSYIRQWEIEPPSFSRVKSTMANASLGSVIFYSECASCHGFDGEGGIGPALNEQSFLELASERFLYNTIANGRSNTAMPAWSKFSARQLSSIIAFIKSWQDIPSKRLSSGSIKGDPSLGKGLFTEVCSSCHGDQGQGGISTAILNPDFLKSVSDEFLYHSMLRGMDRNEDDSWKKRFRNVKELSSNEQKSIVSFMRSQEKVQWENITTKIVTGSPENGKELYYNLCSDCHGLNGEGFIAPALNNRDFLDVASDGFLQASIAIGRGGTFMPPWGKDVMGPWRLNSNEIDDIIVYMRTWNGDRPSKQRSD